MFLVGDIGATKTDLALGTWTNGCFQWRQKQRFLNQDFPHLETILEAFLQKNKDTLLGAALGVAGPVLGEVISLPNCPWKLHLQSLKKTLHLENVILLNDLNACARGIPFLLKEDIAILQKGKGFDSSQTRVVVSAGTGLGHAILCPVQEGKQEILSAEAGHVSFAPRNEEEIDLLRFLWKRWSRVSIERVVSGAGLVVLYEYFSEKCGSSTTTKILSQSEPSAWISRNALEQNDSLCQNALRTFIQLYGAQSGDFALSTLAQGGVYLAGGIPPKILSALQKNDFLEAFQAKGRLSSWMAEIPVGVVLNPDVSLIGAASVFL